jgi:hypothetical protein
VKERTLAREVEASKLAGGTLRDAETANARGLERLEARKRLRKPRRAKAARPRHVDQPGDGVTRRIAPVRQMPISKCQHCGACLTCKMERRVMQIFAKGRQEGLGGVCFSLSMDLAGLTMACSQRSNYTDLGGSRYPFAELEPRDRVRARVRGFEAACDRSVAWLGAWR